MQDPISYITNPEKFGPGTWWTMHTLAYKADNYVDNAAAANIIKYIIDNLPCLDPCRKHAQAYWAKNPATNYLAQPKGVFWWSVDFHNAVNRRLNEENPNRLAKPIFTKQQALQLYGPTSTVCTVNCDSHNINNNLPYSPPIIDNVAFTTTPHYKIVIRPLSPPRGVK